MNLGLGAPRLVVAAALGAGLLLASCSSSPTTPANSTGTTAPSSVTTTTSSTTTSTTTTTVPGVATCLPNQLKISVGPSQGAAGTIELGINLVNISTTTCQLDGYPGMLLLDANGKALPTNVIRGGGPMFGPALANSAPTMVVLGPSQPATFSLSYEEIPVGTETSCATSTSAEITPPNDTGFNVIALAADPCNGGTIHVSPVFPGTATN